MEVAKTENNVGSKRWQSYVAASAAGALMTLGTTVGADVTYVDVGVLLEDQRPSDGAFSSFGPYTFGAPGASFLLRHAFTSYGTSDVGILTIEGYGNLSFVLRYNYPSNIAYKQRISTQRFDNPVFDTGNLAWGAGDGFSEFLEPGTGYIGFRFDVGEGTQYGWLELEMIDGAPDNRAIFQGYAWGAPGDEVFVGVVPEPGALGVLALGSLGLLAWRKRRGN